MHDLVMIKDEECANNDDNEEDSEIYCGDVSAWARGKGGYGLRYRLVKSLSLSKIARKSTNVFWLSALVSLGVGLGVLLIARTSLVTGL